MKVLSITNRWAVSLSAIVAVLQLSFLADLSGQAFCALRDPAKDIYELFPDADSVRVINEPLDSDRLKHLKELLGNSGEAEGLPEVVISKVFGKNNIILGIIVQLRFSMGEHGYLPVRWIFDGNLVLVDLVTENKKKSEKVNGTFRELIATEITGIVQPYLSVK